jgi:hypothetical protein
VIVWERLTFPPLPRPDMFYSDGELKSSDGGMKEKCVDARRETRRLLCV